MGVQTDELEWASVKIMPSDASLLSWGVRILLLSGLSAWMSP